MIHVFALDELPRAVLLQCCDCSAVEMVEVLVRDESDVRLRELRIVSPGRILRHGIDLDFESVVLDAQAGVLDGGYDDILNGSLPLAKRRLEIFGSSECLVEEHE